MTFAHRGKPCACMCACLAVVHMPIYLQASVVGALGPECPAVRANAGGYVPPPYALTKGANHYPKLATFPLCLAT